LGQRRGRGQLGIGINARLSSRIRPGSCDDLAAVLDLWTAADAVPTPTDRVEPLRVLLSVDPGALIVADADGELVGSLIAAWNGWRGSFYRLAVHPDHRRRGLATLLVRAGEMRLRERGALRLDALVADDQPAALRFWSAAGYELQGDRRRFVRNFGAAP
jgi:ribosomal protein S18 acetylase RimI-like enzyme